MLARDPTTRLRLDGSRAGARGDDQPLPITAGGVRGLHDSKDLWRERLDRHRLIGEVVAGGVHCPRHRDDGVLDKELVGGRQDNVDNRRRLRSDWLVTTSAARECSNKESHRAYHTPVAHRPPLSKGPSSAQQCTCHPVCAHDVAHIRSHSSLHHQRPVLNVVVGHSYVAAALNADEESVAWPVASKAVCRQPQPSDANGTPCRSVANPSIRR